MQSAVCHENVLVHVVWRLPNISIGETRDACRSVLGITGKKLQVMYLIEFSLEIGMRGGRHVRWALICIGFLCDSGCHR